MAKIILDKEQLSTKDNRTKEHDKAKFPNDIDKKKIEDSQHNETDTKSSTDSFSINDAPSSISLRKYVPLFFVIIGFLLFICIFSTVFAFANIKSDKIISGIHINGIDVSGLTSNEANEKLSNQFSQKLNSTLTLAYQDYKTELIPTQDIDANYDISAAIQKAYSIGRSGNFIQNNYEIFFSFLSLKNVTANLQYNIEKLNLYIDSISLEIPGLVEQPSYYIEDNNLIIVKGKSGVELMQDETKNLILSNIDTLSSSNSINIPTNVLEPDKIDINKIHEEIYSEPENAYIIKEPFELNLGSSGTDFSITVEEAENLLKDEKDEYIIPLKITSPEIGVEDLGDAIFSDTLGDYSSKFNVYNYNRTTNVNLATKKINNVILLPGETFSYNKVVGERTVANGFKEASVYTSSGVVNGLGGGICQVSSTLYNAVLEANLEITERKNHSYAVTYVPLGRDATVSYGSIDFKFKNNRNYPIKVTAYTKNGTLTVSIKGIKEETEYDVLITTKKLQTTPYKTKYIEDNSLPAGTKKQIQYGDYGYKYETYKTLKLNGEIISSELISKDTYIPLTRIVKVGTKQAQAVTPPTTNVIIDSNTNNNNTAEDASSTDNNNSNSDNMDNDTSQIDTDSSSTTTEMSS